METNIIIPHLRTFTLSFAHAQLNPDIINIIQLINISVILSYLENITAFGPRVTGTPSCTNAGRYLYNTFISMNLQVNYHNWTANIGNGQISGSNIEATLSGTNPSSNEIYLICAHYDSVAGSPGADDDGSGTAAVLTAAKILSQYSFNHTIRFVTFSGEEQGLLGSHAYAEEAYQQSENIAAVLNADMIGYAHFTDDGKKIQVLDSEESEWITRFTENISQIYAAYIDLQVIPQSFGAGSDYYSFYEFGYNAIGYEEYFYNPNYHTPNDTIQNMNLTYTTKGVRLITATLSSLVLLPLLPPYQPHNPNPENGTINVSFHPDISWTGGDPNPEDTVTYDIFFGNMSPPSKVISNQTGTIYYPGILNFETTYYWQIIARDNHGLSTCGPLWFFITRSNRPPYIPRNPSPENGTINVNVTSHLTWIGGDPDLNDSVTYDVYLGTTNPPPQIAKNVTNTTFDPGILVDNVTYFWQIVAWDEGSFSTPGPLWHFTTQVLPHIVYVDDDYNETTPGWNSTHFNNIQQGINAVGQPGTVQVFDGTYYEQIVIQKSINLIGESQENTIIEKTPEGGGIAVSILHDHITISGFSIRGAQYDPFDLGVYSSSSSTIITNINLNAIVFGIVLVGENEPSLSNYISTTFIDLGNNGICGIYLYNSQYTTVTRSLITHSVGFGIALTKSINNDIYENTLIENEVGISTNFHYDSKEFRFQNYETQPGEPSFNNVIYHNNFINNTLQAYDEYSNLWYNTILGQGNHWSDFNEINEGAYDNDSDGIVDSLYHINGGDNQDLFPLMYPFSLGDLNCDGKINFGDINPFVLALSDPIAYKAIYHLLPSLHGDINQDSVFNFGDINPFVALLTNG